jgi:hypothetical protein
MAEEVLASEKYLTRLYQQAVPDTSGPIERLVYSPNGTVAESESREAIRLTLDI